MAPQRARTAVVEHYWQCPKVTCKLKIQHWDANFCPILPKPDRVPSIDINRFSADGEPFFHQNVWNITKRPSFVLDTGNQIFLTDYGTIRLRMRTQSGVKGWRLFDGYDTNEIWVVKLVAPKGWTQKHPPPNKKDTIHHL